MTAPMTATWIQAALSGSFFLNEEFKDLRATANKIKDEYQRADPFPSTRFNNFFNSDILDAILEEFPDMGINGNLKYSTPNEIKLASKGEHRFASVTEAFVHFLNSEPFLD